MVDTVKLDNFGSAVAVVNVIKLDAVHEPAGDEGVVRRNRLSLLSAMESPSDNVGAGRLGNFLGSHKNSFVG